MVLHLMELLDVAGNLCLFDTQVAGYANYKLSTAVDSSVVAHGQFAKCQYVKSGYTNPGRRVFVNL